MRWERIVWSKTIITWLRVFFVMVFVEFLWIQYIMNASSGQPNGAALWMTVIFIAGAFVVTEYVKNKWLLIPAAMGVYTGSYWGVIAHIQKWFS